MVCEPILRSTTICAPNWLLSLQKYLIVAEIAIIRFLLWHLLYHTLDWRYLWVMCRVNKYIMIHMDLNPGFWWYGTEHKYCLWLETSQSQAKQIKDSVDIQSITQTSICICVSGIHNLRCLLNNIKQSKKIPIFDFFYLLQKFGESNNRKIF